MGSEKTDEATNQKNSGDASFSDEMLKLAQCLMPVPPTAKVKRLIDRSAVEAKLSEVAWKTYDSIVGLAAQTTNRVLSNQGVGNVLGTSLDLMLRWQRFNSAVAGAMFSAVWPAVGLPTGSEVAAVRADIRGLREDLRAALAEAETNEDYARQLHEAVRHSIINEQDVADQVRKSSGRQISVWSGWAGGEHRETSEDVGN
jgi:uncharacterized protein YbjT (DUF2867 family)